MAKEMEHPWFYLVTAPKKYFSIPNFFSDKPNSVRQLLADPDGLRQMGWNMMTLDDPDLVNGEYWQVNNGDRKIIRVYRDGKIFAKVDAGPDFLGWGIDANKGSLSYYINS